MVLIFYIESFDPFLIPSLDVKNNLYIKEVCLKGFYIGTAKKPLDFTVYEG